MSVHDIIGPWGQHDFGHLIQAYDQGQVLQGLLLLRSEKFPLVSMGGRAEGQACADPGARTPIGASGIYFLFPD